MMAHCNKLFILALASGILNLSNGKAFTCEDGSGSTCIILEMDAIFNVTMSGNETRTAMISLETATVDKNACICQDPSMSIKTFRSNDNLTVHFPLKAANVFMTPLFYMNPHKHFNTSGPNLIEFATSADIPIGINGSSYKCMSSQIIAFHRTRLYDMTMTMTNFHVQAYGIKDGNFSPATTCSADMSTVRPVPTGKTSPGTTTPMSWQPSSHTMSTQGSHSTGRTPSDATTPISHTMSTHEPNSAITPVIICIMYFLYK